MTDTKVIAYHFAGNSFPIVIQRGTKKWLVKLRAGLSGEYALLSEWLGNRMGNLIGLNTRQPHWIELTKALEYDTIYIEVKDLIDKSLGINIGFEYVEKLKTFDSDQVEQVDKAIQIQLYLLDLLLLNIDRTSQNHNLLFDGSTLLISDFDASLIFSTLIKNGTLRQNPQVLQCLKSHPFYQKVNEKQLNTFLHKINRIDFNQLISEIPEELLSQSTKQIVLTKIEEQKANGWTLNELLKNIENTTLETAREKTRRTTENREKLEKRIAAARKKQ